jgi:branched-chain amino acid transport system permease protein
MKSLFTIKEGGVAHWAIRLVASAAVLAVLLFVPTKASDSLISTCTEALVFMIAAMSLNLLLGYTGQISIGHSAFFGIGVYTAAILISRYDINPWLTFPASFVIAFVVGVLVSFPAARIKGVYLALVTLALALIFPSLLRWRKLVWLTGGGTGLPADDSKVQSTGFNIGLPKRGQMQRWEIFGWDPFGDLRGTNSAPFFYWIALLTVVVVYLACRGVVKSKAGRSMIAIRDNETAAAVMGVNLVMTKALVFGLSAGLCSLAGTVTSLRVGTVSPEGILNVTVFGAITFLIVMVIGGAGSLWGPIIGAAVFVFVSDITGGWADDQSIPAPLRPVLGFSEVPPGTGIFAVALILLMFFAPRGIAGLWKQHSPRIVRVIPRPAGSHVAAAGSLAEVITTTQGENQ